ncbi:MAG: hypothetical protein IK102_04140 [Treponema sp.]|nr:hypothetical protein [Treponema sp.]
MGDAVDLEAPVITITSPAKFSYQKLKFSLTGTCTDNLLVEKVVVTDKETGRLFGEAVITGETWKLDLNLKKEDEGEITFLCEAIDHKHNTSTHSARSITLLVDEHAPEAKSWYVDRGNSIQTQLESKAFLEGLDFNLSRNKNYPQNEEFTLYGDFYDAMGIDTITVKLYEEDELVIEKTVNAQESSPYYIGSGKSIFSPSFNFTHDELVTAKSSLASGKHYFRVVYYAKDNDDPVNHNEQERDVGKYILWYPESDYPGVQQVNVNTENKIRASVGSSIPVDFFDDDGLTAIYCQLKNTYTGDPNDYKSASAFPDPDPNAKEAVVTNASINNLMDYPESITAPDIPKGMYLIAAAVDVNSNWTVRVIPVEVTDSNKPMLFVEKPVENEKPEMGTTAHPNSDRIFSFKGYSLDTKGADYIKIVYEPMLPTEGDREQSAKNLLAQNENDKTAKKVISGTNQVIWYQKIQGSDTSTAGWNKQLFEIEMNLFDDFKDASGNSTSTAQKFFEIVLVDTDGNEVFKPFILDGDSESPLIDIQTPVKELDVHDYTVNDLVIKFKGYKNSHIGMKPELYKITTKIGNSSKKFVSVNAPTTESSGAESQKISAPDSEGYVTLTIPKATLTTWAATEAQPTFTFYATDIFGNGGKGEDMRSVILSPKPTITAITIDKDNGTYKKGDVLKFKVSFSKQVKKGGTSDPRLKLSNITGVAADNLYATYDSGDMTNAFTFKWTVPENAESSGIVCEGFDLAIDSETQQPKENVLANGATIHATELGEGGIYTSITGIPVLADKIIKLDGVIPKIAENGIHVYAEDGNDYCTTGKKINAELTLSEDILVSGSPVLLLTIDTQTVNFTFERLAGNKLYFSHTVVSTETPQTPKTPEGTISYSLGSCFSAAHKKLITDKAGNELDLTKNTTSGDSTVVVDYTKPGKPGISKPTTGTYNATQQIELSNLQQTGATAYYSYDGGISWHEYDKNNLHTLEAGTYKLKAYQKDLAGNESEFYDGGTVVINNVFPKVTNFTVDVADGNYGAGKVIPFTLDFSDEINVSAVSDLVLTFKDKNGGNTNTFNLKAVPAGGKASSFTFEYEVKSTDNFTGIVVSQIAIKNTVKDNYNNTPAVTAYTASNCTFIGATDGGKRESIVCDGVAPTISTYVPAQDGISTITDNSSGSFKITLTFSENVSKEVGTIILQRKGDWAIPAVMTNDEFLKYYNKMSEANKKIVRRMGEDGDDLKHHQTGIEVGPYRRITHGLKNNGTNYVPDTDTKFVLAYDLDLYSGTATLDNIQKQADGTYKYITEDVSVEQIRAALASVGYHQHKVDVASEFVKITENKVEITFAEDVEDGREWELIIPDTAFRDNSENFFAGLDEGDYSFWSNNVAQPVVRVDRYTHGWGAHEPNADGSAFTDITVNQGKYKNQNPADNTSAKLAPTGYVRARIDCETPGAAIKYSKLGINGTAWTTTAPAGVAYNATGGTTTTGNANGTYTYMRQVLADITTAAINKRGATAYTQGADIIIGDGNYIAARKDYITAYATKTGYTDSVNGYEGVFKTIVYLTSNNQARIINIEGGTAPGGQSCVFGFPLKDATDENDPTNAGRYSKNMYVVDGNTRKNFAFVSYEILSKDWAVLVCNANHSRVYPLNDYGGSVYITAMTYYY